MRRAPTSRIAVRVAAAFAIILGFFVVALGVTDRILDRIGEAEARVETLDRAKHAGHHVAAMAREMYIHQAHTILLFDLSHMGQYEHWVERTKKATQHLLHIAPTPEDRARAEQIGELAERIDAEFRSSILPAIERGAKDELVARHERIDAIRREVIQSNRKLAAEFEERALEARVDAAQLRSRARLGILGCTGLAALAAILLGSLLLRSVLQPISILREGALRVAEGDLDARIDWPRDDEFGDLADTFNQMTADLQQSQAAALEAQRLRILGEVTAGVAHELNNPLGVILGYLKLIKKDGNPSEERLATITDEAEQCQRIVADLLAAVRPTDLEPSRVDLGQLAADSAARWSGAAEGPRVVVRHADDTHTWGDPARLRQVLDNLIGNAIDASPEGIVTIEVTTDAETSRVRVADEGPGVGAADQDRIFDPFFTTKATGTGLGLAISRSIVEAHGGHLELARRDKGACFEIQLPRHARPEAAE